MTDQMTADLAARLYSAEANKSVVAPLTLEHPDLSVELAYGIQLANVKRRLEKGDRVVGHKIGLTSRPMQAMLGVNEPDFGHLFESMHYQSGDVVDYPLIQPKVEPELAFILREDLVGPNVGVQDVLRATRFVLPAIEVIDSRIADWNIKLVDTVADNASSGCFVLSHTAHSIENADILLSGAILKVNGQIVQTGAGAAVVGNPALAVAWLANKLSSLGTTLKTGDIILSGAVSAAVPVASGDHVSLTFGRLGRVDLTIKG
ncbi:2-keto-4-pentenoate hydratase [Alicyclobacillus fastidiosus]|uniref:2-keto-4-pentenoate hydratase n=1 Tax=Alicyclobacillus fastidiosus TaxID=392011 RepID=A0ABV5AC46_9BACL|nr:2-keto-4-pentenoate hydratase [Alicyclobacillus fastidiosus]WEH11511.1 2-keto-4-pentenoate hydratase [Alicyclobacillus fastidiosus]